MWISPILRVTQIGGMDTFQQSTLSKSLFRNSHLVANFEYTFYANFNENPTGKDVESRTYGCGLFITRLELRKIL